MAVYQQNNSFNYIEATLTSGEQVTIDVRSRFNRADNHLVTTGLVKMPDMDKRTVFIKDVTGAPDGARSEVQTKQNQPTSRTMSKAPALVQTYRLTESPESLCKIFRQAGLDVPPVKRGLGVILRAMLNKDQTLEII